jgi:hypothetical protein
MTEPLAADGLEEALIGLGTQGDRVLLVYDLAAVRRVLVAQGCPADQVDEHMSFNILGAWVGEGTPVFVERMTIEEVCERLA